MFKKEIYCPDCVKVFQIIERPKGTYTSSGLGTAIKDLTCCVCQAIIPQGERAYACTTWNGKVEYKAWEAGFIQSIPGTRFIFKKKINHEILTTIEFPGHAHPIQSVVINHIGSAYRLKMMRSYAGKYLLCQVRPTVPGNAYVIITIEGNNSYRVFKYFAERSQAVKALQEIANSRQSEIKI
jgi:hypothetical protein